MYIIFIFSAASIITPVLLSLSTVLVDILSSTMSQITIPSTSLSTLPIQPSGGTISILFLQIFIISFLFMNCLMASFLLGMISKGKQRAGIRYFLPMIALAIPIFLVVQYIARSALSGLFNF